MTLRRSCRSQEYITGRSPTGAQVRRTRGWSIRPVSSRNSTLWPCFAAFFYSWPIHPPPAGDGLLIAFPGSSGRLLAAPAQGQEDSPDLAGVIHHAKMNRDHLGHAGERPQVIGIAMM